MEVMDLVAVIEVLPVPKPPLDAALMLRRSTRCLNRTSHPTYREQEEPKESANWWHDSKRKWDEDSLKPVRTGPEVEHSDRKPMPAIATEPVSCAGFAVPAPAAEGEVHGNGKSGKLWVKET